MSTSYGLRCWDHDPPLDSEHWAQGNADELGKLTAALLVRADIGAGLLTVSFLLDSSGWGILKWDSAGYVRRDVFDDACQQLNEAQARIAKTLELHMSGWRPNAGDDTQSCQECYKVWPCPTCKILTGEADD